MAIKDLECIDFEGSPAVVMDHAAHPRNHGPLKDFDGHVRIAGPCGDTMEFWLTASNGKIEQVSFITDGCGSSLACGSMATTLAEGKRIEDAAVLRQQGILNALGGLSPELEHCALLVANTLEMACEDYWKHRKGASKDSGSAQATCDTCGDKDSSASNRKKDESDEEFEDCRNPWVSLNKRP